MSARREGVLARPRAAVRRRTSLRPAYRRGERTATRRRYLMCQPYPFDAVEADRPWTDRSSAPLTSRRALMQWGCLYSLYLSLGHDVRLIGPLPGLPDGVRAAATAAVVDGRVLGARRGGPAGEPAYLDWFRTHGFTDVRGAVHANEGARDVLATDRWILAGRQVGSAPEAHREALDFFRRPLISLELADPRFQHLDTALAVLDGDEVMYHPAAFTEVSRDVLAGLFPDALLVDEPAAASPALNAVSDGLHVVLPETAEAVAPALRERGFRPLLLDLSELVRGDGGVKSCTLELGPGAS
ncbi:dimethylarginine dimethylaminohydrolase family protein [Streptomyces ossamyceticus]|uniref:dimethylarginine dimethylaminohydrolase family protein n=1 Tax=Streptomyces ossamyceticus TaxID=249581 RepID=UPI000A6DDAE3|nr:amidinotransferase [Streptomyces ossamyceticus]